MQPCWCSPSQWARTMRAAQVTSWGDAQAAGSRVPLQEARLLGAGLVTREPTPSVQEAGNLERDCVFPSGFGRDAECFSQRLPRSRTPLPLLSAASLVPPRDQHQ